MPTAPIVRFLGDVRPELGPFGLLALEPRPYTPAQINHALHACLARLARHPQGMSADADEVRLALHVAAAQLRDPAVQREVLVECTYLPASSQPARGGSPPASLAPGSAQGLRVAAATSQLAMFERAALWVLAHSGGWNIEAKRRLGSLAHTFNIDPDDFRLALTRIAHRLAAPSPQPLPPAAAASTPSTDREVADTQPRAPAGAVSWIRIALLLLLMLSSVLMAIELKAVRPRRASDTDAPVSHAGTPAMGDLTSAPSSVPTLSQEDNAASDHVLTPLPEIETVPSSDSEHAVRTPTDQPSTPLDMVVENWARSARRIIDRNLGDAAPYDQLAQAVRIALVNLSAAQNWDSMPDAGRDSLRRADRFGAPSLRPAGAVVPDLASWTSPGMNGDGEIALLLLLARRQPVQYLAALQQIRIGSDPLAPADCDVIADSALAGTPNDLRQLARGFVVRQSDNPVMIYAVIEALLGAPRNRAVSSLVEEVSRRSLPDVHAGAWELQAHRALTSRLFELLGHVTSGGIDELADELLVIYAARANGSGAVAIAASQTADPRAADTLWQAWRRRVDQYLGTVGLRQRIAEAEQQRDMRRALAQDDVQRFATEQVAIVEMMSHVVRAERPSQWAAVSAVLDAMSARRRSAPHVFAQIAAAERAMTHLWLIRFGTQPGRIGGRS